MVHDVQRVSLKIIELAAEEGGVEPATVTPASHFVDDLKYDSLSMVEFAMAVEDEFEISIPDEDAQRLQTVGSVIEYVQKRLADARSVKA